MIEQINHLAQGWWDWMSAMFWQVGLLILLIAVIDLLIRRWAWPQLRYALWSLVLIKLILSPTLSLPSGLAPKLKPVVTQMLESAIREEPTEVTLPIKIPSANDEFRRPMVRYSPSGPVIAESNDRIVCFLGEHTGPSRAEYMPAPVEIPASIVSKHEQSDEPMPDKPLQVARSSDNVIMPPADPRLGWRVYAMGIWFLGVVALSAWLFVKLRRLSREYIDKSQDGGQPSAPAVPKRTLPESFYNQLDRCAQQLNLRRKPRVVTTRRIQSPAVFGLFGPILLIPVGYLRRLSRKDTEYMLLHELAHIKRGDLVAHSLCMLIQLAYWYNPLLWLVCKQLRHLRELCCDATVASLLRDKTAEYRQTLLETARRFLATPAESGLGLVGLFEDSNRLVARINWLKKPVWRYRKMKNVAVITAVLVLLACVLPMAQGQNPQAEDPNVSSEHAEEKSTQAEQSSDNEKEEQEQKQKQLEAVQLLMAKLEQLQIEKQRIEKELQALMKAQEKARQAKSDVAQAKMETEKSKSEVAKVKVGADMTKVEADMRKAEAEMRKAEADRRKANAERHKADADIRKADAEAHKAEAEAKKWEQWATMWTNSEAFKQWQKKMEQWAIERAKADAKAKEEADAFPRPAPEPKPRPMPEMPPMPPMPLDIETGTKTEVDVVDTPDVPEAITPVPPAVPSIPSSTPPESPTGVAPTPPVPPAPPSAVISPPEPVRVVAPSPPLSLMAVPTPPEPPTVGAPTPLPPATPRVTAANPSEKRIPEVLITEDFIDKDLMQDVLPALADKAGIPIIPDETVKGSVTCTLKEVPLDKALDIILAGTRYAVKKTAYYYLISSRDDKATRSPDAGKTPTSNLPLLGMPAEVVGPAPAAAEPKPKPGRDIKIRKSKDDKYIATTEMHFISKVKPGSPFVIRNSLGNIILRPSKDSTCNVKAVIRAEAKTAVEAQEMVEQVSMKLDSSDERYYLKPIKPDDDQWSNLNVDLTIAVPLGVRPDIKTKLGNVQLFGLKGPIKALTDLGSVKAVNTTGDLELLSKMGDIVFAASKDLSAKLRAETQMGSIASDLPLNIEKIDMFKRKAEGTFGSGRDTIRLTTNMGSIRISKQSQNTSPSDPKPLNVSEKNNQNNADKPTIE